MEIEMKILVIPDIHGEMTWADQAYTALGNGRHVIFLGDYVDSYDPAVSGVEISYNLNAIINFKKKFPEDVTLLLGNHDLAYVFSKTYTSGFNPTMWYAYRELFESNWDLFDLAWGYKNPDTDRYTLLTHAGLTDHHWGNIIAEIEDKDSRMFKLFGADWETLSIHEILNYFKNNMELLWQVGQIRRGIDITGSVIWADKSELIRDRFVGIDQIVGHTNSNAFEIEKIDGDTLYFTDIRQGENIIAFKTQL